MIEPRAYVSDEWFALMSASRGSYQETMACSVPDGRRNIPLTTVAAVLAALREPSEAMMGAARNVLLNGGRMSDAFLAMLDQFEKEQQP